MALVAPFLLLILFGIIEFAWVFGQNLSVSHAAREGSRLAAIAFGDENAIGTEVCNRTDLLSSIDITFTSDPTKVGDSGAVEVGDEVEVEVTAATNTLTGFLDGMMPATLGSTVAIRIEQGQSWTDGTYTISCP